MLGKIKEITKLSNLRKAYLYAAKNGLRNTVYACAERILQKNNDCYEKRVLTDQERKFQEERIFKDKEIFSILVPAYNTDASQFCEMVESVRNQTYPFWELIIADASPSDRLAVELEQYKDGRIRYKKLTENRGISCNSNQALAMAEGSFIGLLDHDDTLEEDALYEMMCAIEDGKREGHCPWLLYTDEDKGNSDLSSYFEPHFKVKFNLDLMLSNNYICHFLVMKADYMKQLGFRQEYDGAQDYDLILRGVAGLLKEPERIIHIPKVLYHWRCHTGSTAENPRSKMYAYEAGKRAVEDFCRKQGWNVKVSHMRHLGFYRVDYLPDLFSQRKDIAAVGGMIAKNGRIAGGAYLLDGTVLYRRLPVCFSGYMHRAVLIQDVDGVDPRNIQVREELRPLYDSVLLKESDPRRAGLRFGKETAKRGYRILWDPQRKP